MVEYHVLQLPICHVESVHVGLRGLANVVGLFLPLCVASLIPLWLELDRLFG